MAERYRCGVCGSPNPGAHYGAFPCPGDATLRPLHARAIWDGAMSRWLEPAVLHAPNGVPVDKRVHKAMRSGGR